MKDRILQLIPGIEDNEYQYLKQITSSLDDEEFRTFCVFYNTKRKSSDTILLLTLLGFVGFAGIQRIITGQIAMGILYFFTCGICFIGTIVDLINHKSLALEANRKAADETLIAIR